MVRLGGKSTPRTSPLSLQNQKTDFKLGKADWKVIDTFKSLSEHSADKLQKAFERYEDWKVRYDELLEYLEFEDPDYHKAFRVPQSADGMLRVGKKGKAVDPFYLLRRWHEGRDAGIFTSHSHVTQSSSIWEMPVPSRQRQIDKWRFEMLKELVADIHCIAKQYDECQSQLADKFAERDAHKISTKRIVGCTTTAAAKYCKELKSAAPDVLLVEEAGEILESHVLTALGETAEQLILIGDHKYKSCIFFINYILICGRQTTSSQNQSLSTYGREGRGL
jgi:hypothetical protein